MSNIQVDGFGTYGTGSTTAVEDALLAGAYAEINSDAGITLGALPWDATNKDTWLTGGNPNLGSGPYYTLRRVLPDAKSKVRFSFHMALPSLPTSNNRAGPIRFLDSSNDTIATLMVGSTGSLILDYGGSTDLVTTGPVIVAEKDHHIELEIDVTGQTFKAYVDGTKVLDGSSVVFSNTNDVAQYGLVMWSSTSSALYITSIIVRDDSGDYNNTFPIGDRRVATLFVNADDPDHTGWTAQPLHKFGTGILDLTAGSAAVYAAATTDTDIGDSDFTIEGQFRFQTLPTGSKRATLFGKWDADNDQRSYELYLGGPDLENGLLVFRTSTDGKDGTVAETGKWDWSPVTGHWYHVALTRSSGELRLFIDGTLQGIAIADSDTYFAGTAHPAIGAAMDSTQVASNTSLDGWQDEFRLTIGAARYTADFTAPTEAFPRNDDDADWADVAWLSSWDNSDEADDGPNNLTLVPLGTAAAITPNDGDADYQTIDEHTPDDDTFIEAALLPATGTFTMTAVPTATETVTVGTKAASTAAVYTWVATPASAFDVAIGADIATCASNLAAAINAGDGSGTAYGTSTTANLDVTAEVNEADQVVVTASTPGDDGNSIASTETCTAASWGGTTLSGGADIPGYSQFGMDHLPPDVTAVDSITLVSRSWKTDSGSGSIKQFFVGSDGNASVPDAAHVLGTTPNLVFDTVEEDPDTSAALTPTSILLGKFKIDRTA